ncbi:hypothetical protein GQ457_08G017730 [Hibiscus cannabinus]
MNSKPILKTLYLMEVEASLVYTQKLFRIFQDEMVHAQNEIVDKMSESSNLWFNSVMLHSLEFSEKVTRSDKHYNFVICGIKMCEELDNLAIDLKKKSASIDDYRMLEGCSVLHNGITLRDPIHVITKRYIDSSFVHNHQIYLG